MCSAPCPFLLIVAPNTYKHSLIETLSAIIIFFTEKITKLVATEVNNHVRFNVNLILGPDVDGVRPSSIADMGGLVASGEGTAAGWPKMVLEGPRLKPKFGRLAVGGGLEADPEGVVGAAPLLNSAQRGHFRFVFIWPI